MCRYSTHPIDTISLHRTISMVCWSYWLLQICDLIYLAHFIANNGFRWNAWWLGDGGKKARERYKCTLLFYRQFCRNVACCSRFTFEVWKSATISFARTRHAIAATQIQVKYFINDSVIMRKRHNINCCSIHTQRKSSKIQSPPHGINAIFAILGNETQFFLCTAFLFGSAITSSRRLIDSHYH